MHKITSRSKLSGLFALILALCPIASGCGAGLPMVRTVLSVTAGSTAKDELSENEAPELHITLEISMPPESSAPDSGPKEESGAAPSDESAPKDAED